MKRKTGLLVLLLLFFTAAFSQETWNIDNAHSNINFEVGWEDFSMRTGSFKVFEGSVITNADNDLTKATYQLKVDPNSSNSMTPLSPSW